MYYYSQNLLHIYTCWYTSECISCQTLPPQPLLDTYKLANYSDDCYISALVYAEFHQCILSCTHLVLCLASDCFRTWL